MTNSYYNTLDEEEDERKLNPLSIPHILKQILSYSQLKDLKSSRLVSKHWNHCSSRFFRLRSKLYIYNFHQIDKLMTLSSNNFPLNLCHNVCLFGKEFQDLVILLRPFFKKFGTYINSLDISHGIGDVTEEFVIQIAQHIPYLEELSLSGSSVMYTDRNIVLLNRYPIYLPSVKILKIKINPNCFKRLSDVRTFFGDLFSIFPNVETISFIGYQLQELFKYLPEEIKFTKLQNIRLQLFNSEGLISFAQRGFCLSKIVLDIEPLLGLSNLHGFLQAFSSTLKYLDMSFNYKGEYNYSHNATAFPSSRFLKKLSFLRLYGFWGSVYFLNDFTELSQAVVEKMQFRIAFPEGIDQLCKSGRRVLKFFDENGTFCSLNEF